MFRRFASACLKILPTSGILTSALTLIAGATELAEFPQVSRLWLCHVNGTLAANKRIPIISEGTGTMLMLIPNDATVEKGQIFAIFRPERLELERESLALEKSLLDTKIRETRLDQQDRITSLENQKSEAEAELQELTAAMSLQEIKTNPSFERRISEAILAGEQKIQRLEARLTILMQNIAEDTEVVRLKLEQRRQEQDFENIKQNAEKRSPFDGSFTLADELAEEFGKLPAPYELQVETAEPLGHITDSSSYEVTLSEYPPILNSATLEELVMELHLPGSATPLIASFLETKDLAGPATGYNRQRLLVFQIQAEDRTRAEPIAGGSPFAQIFQNLPDGCHVVPKAELLRLLGGKEKPQTGGWAAIARAVWPDAELVATGHRDIALKLTDKPANRDSATER